MTTFYMKMEIQSIENSIEKSQETSLFTPFRGGRFIYINVITVNYINFKHTRNFNLKHQIH